jgi:hypothetical protein
MHLCGLGSTQLWAQKLIVISAVYSVFPQKASQPGPDGRVQAIKASLLCLEKLNWFICNRAGHRWVHPDSLMLARSKVSRRLGTVLRDLVVGSST